MSQSKANYTVRRFHDPLDDLLDRPIAFNPAFKKITGSTVAALMLSQAWYWSKRTSDEDGWFYKTQAEWEDETGLTRSEQETARKHLVADGIMEERLSGIPARLYYRVDKQRIYSLLGVQYAETLQTGMQEPPIPVGDIPANINRNTETTTESTHTDAPPLSSKDQEECNRKVDAILENEGKAAASWPGREKIPEPVRELLDVYVQVTGQKPTKGDLMTWLATGQDWLELHAQPADIRGAYKKAHPDDGKDKGFMVNHPRSLTRTISMIVGERRLKGSGMTRIDRIFADMDRLPH